MVRFIWFVIIVFSMIELFLLWKNWYGFLKNKADRKPGKVTKQYATLALKAVFPGILAIIGLLAAFLR